MLALQTALGESNLQEQKADLAAVQAYENSHEERQVITRVRLELESLRILMQRINKREKLKRDGKNCAISLLP